MIYAETFGSPTFGPERHLPLQHSALSSWCPRSPLPTTPGSTVKISTLCIFSCKRTKHGIISQFSVEVPVSLCRFIFLYGKRGSQIKEKFTNHGVKAVGEAPSQPSRGRAFTAKFFELLLRLVEHFYTLSVPLRQLVQLRQTQTNKKKTNQDILKTTLTDQSAVRTV